MGHLYHGYVTNNQRVTSEYPAPMDSLNSTSPFFQHRPWRWRWHTAAPSRRRIQRPTAPPWAGDGSGVPPHGWGDWKRKTSRSNQKTSKFLRHVDHDDCSKSKKPKTPRVHKNHKIGILMKNFQRILICKVEKKIYHLVI